jgi:hypothetical protein
VSSFYVLNKEEVCTQNYCLGGNISQVIDGRDKHVVQACHLHGLLTVNGRMILNDELEKMSWPILMYSPIILPGGPEEDNERSQLSLG